MNTKKTVYVSIFGRPATGKTTLMQIFQKLLTSFNIETVASWGLDGMPADNSLVGPRLKAIAEKVRVVLTETRQKKLVASSRLESPDDYQVKVEHVIGIGYIVSVTVAGTVLQHNFGERFPVLKERARAVAARLANELGVEVVDTIPNEYERVQAPVTEY